ncbi:hypothetical protein ABIE52_004682 [Rhodococcus sp. OAS809]
MHRWSGASMSTHSPMLDMFDAASTEVRVREMGRCATGTAAGAQRTTPENRTRAKS